MKTQWDYSDLAQAYLKRPDYSEDAIDAFCRKAGAGRHSLACDVGAGVGHLTLMLAVRGMRVIAVEPNDAMRALGEERTRGDGLVRWFEGTGEETGQETGAFDIVTFGSSFNVTDRPKALAETHRLLKPGGWFACLWNHRDLTDPIQARVEEIIRESVPGYSYGARREDQTEVIEASGLFGGIERIEGSIRHVQALADMVEAWRSHATLERQSGARFAEIVGRIEAYLRSLDAAEITVPYTTRLWMAARR